MKIESNTDLAGGLPTASVGMRRVIRVARFLAALLIVVILVAAIGHKDVRASMESCPPELALAAFATAILAQWCAAYRLFLLARSQGFLLSLQEALSLCLASVFYGLFMPGGSATSWTVRLLRLAGPAGRIVPALQLLAGDRALATAAGGMIGLLTGLSVSTLVSGWINGLLAVVTAGATALIYLLFSSHTATAVTWVSRIPLMDKALKRARSSPLALRPPTASVVAVAIGLSVTSHVVSLLGWILLARAIHVDLDPIEIAWIRGTAMVVMLLPATVGGLGLREGAVVFLAGLFGVVAADALALSLLVFATTVFTVAIVGGIFEVKFLIGTGSAHAKRDVLP